MSYRRSIASFALLLAQGAWLPEVGATGTPAYPAANFQPEVIYRDSSVAQSAGSSASRSAQVAVAATDPRYPAAYFQPRVVFSDPSTGNGSSGASSR
jgi:hypothetical protein